MDSAQPKFPSLVYEWSELRRLLGTSRASRALTFYAESGAYRPHFQGVLDALRERPSPEITYLTSDAQDPILSVAEPRLHAFYFHRLLPFVVQFLDARVLAMTMTDLHRYHLRRSVRGAAHAYLFHALVSTHMIYRFGAFDHYDAIFCAGPHHVREIRRAEALYRLKPKRLLEVGYPRLDALMEEHRRFLQEGAASGASGKELAPTSIAYKGTVLVAPSWGASNILESCSTQPVRSLCEQGYRVIVRPHPEFIRRQASALERIRREIGQLPGGSLDLDSSSLRSLHEADLLVTDWSGISLEYAFATERPVLFLDVPRKVNNPRYQELGMAPLEVQIREKIGRVLSPDCLEELPQAAGELLRDRDLFRERIRREREETVFHVGSSARRAAQLLLELCGGV